MVSITTQSEGASDLESTAFIQDHCETSKSMKTGKDGRDKMQRTQRKPSNKAIPIFHGSCEELQHVAASLSAVSI